MEYWLQVSLSILLATLLLLIISFNAFSPNSNKENSLDSRKKGRTILITGPTKSGKTLLYQKLAGASKLLTTVHSLKPNSTIISHNWKLLDLPLDTQTLHSQPADFFHFNDLRSLILCLGAIEDDKKELELIVYMTVATGILKRVPLCIYSSNITDKSVIIDKLLLTLNSLQQSRLSQFTSSSSQTISFEDPINRLIFESADGEIASDHEAKIREYFDENVCLCIGADGVKDWITTL